MAYNPYGNRQYGAPPAYGGFPGANNAPPGMAHSRGLGPPPGMSSAPGMAPPGVQHSSAPQANRPSGLPHHFQPPPNLPNINFNAPVIRLGATSAKPGGPAMMGGRGDMSGPSAGRSGMGMDRGMDQGRSAPREMPLVVVPATKDEKLRTVLIYQIPEGVGGDDGMQKLLGAIGKLRKWDSTPAALENHKGSKFGTAAFGSATFDDVESLSIAIKLLHEEGVEVPVKRQQPAADPPKDDSFEGIEKVKLQAVIDENTLKYIESYEEGRADDSGAEQRLETARAALKAVVRDLFYPPSLTLDGQGDVVMGSAEAGEKVEVINIPLAQDDELADIPAEMREVVAREIAAFRERSNQRDMERLKREEETEETDRQRYGPSRMSRRDSPPFIANNINNIPLGPRGNIQNAPSGPRGQNGQNGQSGQNGQNRIAFVNGGVSNTEYSINTRREDEDSDASDTELYRRHQSKLRADDDQKYLEAERRWINRERFRQAALERERDREQRDAESSEQRKQERLDREKKWNDERELGRKSHAYYRDHGGWARQRASARADEEARDEGDRRAEQEEQRREQAAQERARGMADSFLDQQAQEMEQRQAPSAPQPFKLSLGAAAQRAQASRAVTHKRTIAEVEGLLDDEDVDASSKRQLVPIQFEPTSASDAMTDEEITQAVRALAQEIPSDADGLWKWEVKWDYLDEGILRDKLRPFVEKKIVEYLGVQEEMLVETVEEHLRGHCTAAALTEELEGALDDEAKELVKKLWRMVIFFTECEKRGLPA